MIVLIIILFSNSLMAEEQKILDLSTKDFVRLKEQRAVVEKYLRNEDLETEYLTAAGKLGTLRALLEAEMFEPSQTYELQSMGIVLGDAFVLDMGFHWIIVQDKYGRDPALQYKDTSIIIYPLTMISKRIERGEKVDVFDLYNGVAGIVQEKIGKAD